MKRRHGPALCLGLALLAPALLQAQDPLGVARYSDAGELQRPADLATWVHMGSSLGSDYRSEPFDPAMPGVIGVVQMEPAAYRYFLDNGRYADGSMFLLSFYAAEVNSDPQLQGFVQGDLRAQEIHVIDAQRFDDGRAFFMFQDSTQTASTALEAGNECVQCHEAEGAYNGTFMQFYPALRSLPRN
jgi:cytochrome c553